MAEDWPPCPACWHGNCRGCDGYDLDDWGPCGCHIQALRDGDDLVKHPHTPTNRLKRQEAGR